MDYMKAVGVGMFCSCLGLGGGFQSASAAPVVGQITPVAVYHDLDHPFGLAYDSANNLIWYSRGDSGDNLVHSLRPYRSFTLAEKVALPDIGGEKQLSPAASQNDVAGTTAVAGNSGSGIGAHFSSLAFDAVIGQLVAQSGPDNVLKSFDPFTGANVNFNYRPGFANDGFSDGFDIDGDNVWYSPDIGPILRNGVIVISNGDLSKTLLPAWTGLGTPTGLGWSGVEQVANSLIAVAVHTGADTGRSRTLVRFDATTYQLVGYDPDGDSRAARWEDLAFDGRYLYAADLRGNANGNGVAGDIYVFDVTGGLEPIPCRIRCTGDFDVDGDASGALVIYAPPQMTGDCSNAVVHCAPPSGTIFPPGRTIVSCQLVDAGGLTNSCSFTVNVLQEPGINLAKNNLVQGNGSVGSTFSYELSFDTFAITVPAAGLRLVDPLPPELDFVSMTSNGAISAQYDPVTRTATWNFGTWPPLSAGPTNYLEVRINASAVQGETINNVAVLLSSNLPPRSGQDQRPRCPACPPGVVVGSSNPPPQITCSAITATNDPGQCAAVVLEYSCITAGNPDGVVCVPPAGSTFPRGTTTVTCTASNAAGGASSTFTVTVEDREAPRVSVREAANPADKKIPVAGKVPASGQNPDGFYQLLARDNCDSGPLLYVADSASNFVAGPYASGSIVKITQDPTATPEAKRMAGVVAAHIIIKGDALVYSVDADGNRSEPVNAFVPPPPK